MIIKPNEQCQQNIARSADYYYQKGLQLQFENKFDEAIINYEQALFVNPKYAMAHTAIGNIYKILGNYSNALACYHLAISLDPEDLEAYSSIAILFGEQGKPDEARDVYLKILQINPSSAEAYNNLGLIYDSQGDIDQAILNYQKALEYDTSMIEAQNNLGIALMAKGETAQAITIFENLLSKDNSFSVVHNNLGIAYSDLGDFEKAILCFENATSLTPNYAEAFNNMGLAYKSLLMAEQAEEAFLKAISINPNLAEVYNNLGYVQKSLGKHNDALISFEKTLALNPNHQAAQYMLKALTDQNSELAPDDYIKLLYDQYSPKFESHLKDTLKYTMPDHLKQITIEFEKANINFEKILDLGCGTGMAGSHFRHLTKKMIGVDISPKMLAQAKQKKIYDLLIEGNIIEFMKKNDELFDLILAIDMLIYTGNLTVFFQTLKQRVISDAYVIISTENLDTNDNTASDNSSANVCYRLQKSGRFAHSPNYVVSLAKKNGFETEQIKKINMRMEYGNWIIGNIYLMRNR